MKKLEIGTIVALIIAVVGGTITGAVYIGQLEGRLSALENTEQVKNIALAEISAMKDRALNELYQALELSDGVILPYMGDAEEIPAGWVICGQNDTISLTERFLLGTNDFDKVGQYAGSSGHHHPVNISSSGEVGGRRGPHEGADNFTGAPNWEHQHRVIGDTASTPHIPPAIQVLFLCRPAA